MFILEKADATWSDPVSLELSAGDVTCVVLKSEAAAPRPTKGVCLELEKSQLKKAHQFHCYVDSLVIIRPTYSPSSSRPFVINIHVINS